MGKAEIVRLDLFSMTYSLCESKRTATDVAFPNFRLSSWKRSRRPSQTITSQQTRDSVP